MSRVRPPLLGLACLALVASSCAGSGRRAVEDESSAIDGLTEAGELGSASARIWRQRATLEACGAWNIDEDFSSGRYNAHRYAVTLSAGSSAQIQLARQAGGFGLHRRSAEDPGAVAKGSKEVHSMCLLPGRSSSTFSGSRRRMAHLSLDPCNLG